MRVLNKNELKKINLNSHEFFFVELWYSMTHMQSLDSYRTRCMNSRTIIRELCEELKIAIIRNDELKELCEETLSIISHDPIIQNNFPLLVKEIKQKITEFNQSIQNGKGQQRRNDEKRIQLRFVADDFSAALEKKYFSILTTYLPKAVKRDNENEIKILVDSLLSDLLDRGWPLETLFDWHRHFIKKKKGKEYSFSENLSFMLRVFASPPLEHLVTLRLRGGRKLAQIERFEKIFFVDDSSIKITLDKSVKKKFLSGQSIGYAQIEVQGMDALSAAIQAREQLEQMADLLRFDFAPSKLQVERLCHVRRLKDDREYFSTVRTAVPNPTEKNEYQDFNMFARDLDIVCNKTKIKESSRKQLQAAIRQYRFGRDSENYKDKFLNWWMGLEALTRVDQKKDIGLSVAENVSKVMVIPYLHRLVRDLSITLKYCKISWPGILVDFSGCVHLEELTVNQLITILQSEKHQKALLEQCTKFPVLSFRGKEIADSLFDPQKTAKRLEDHLQHLQWHLARIYRIRCCIVHGASIRFRLGLITANLEYYLKQVILLTIRSFKHYDQIVNLSELFSRASFSYQRTIQSLKDENSGQEEIRNAVFTNYVIDEKTLIEQ